MRSSTGAADRSILQPARRGFRLRPRVAWSGKASSKICTDGAGGLRQIGDLRRGQAEIGRHPDRAQHPGREHRLQHGVGIARMQQNAIACRTPRAASAAGAAWTRRLNSRPGPDRVAPDDRAAVREPRVRSDQQMREIDWSGSAQTGSRIDT